MTPSQVDAELAQWLPGRLSTPGVMNFHSIPSLRGNVARTDNRAVWWLERNAKDSVVSALNSGKSDLVVNPRIDVILR